MLRRLRVAGYKSLVDVDVSFSPLTVVFGPNAAGKSNLLDAIALLARMGTEANLDEAFATHRGTPIEAFSLPPGGIAEMLETDTPRRFRLVADVELSEAVVDRVEEEIRKAREGLSEPHPPKRRSVKERSLRYTLEIEIVPSSGVLRVADERLEALNRNGEPKASRKPFLETMLDKDRIHLRMEKQSHPNYEDLHQDRTVVSKPLYAPHYPHITAFRLELERWRFYFLEPSAMRRDSAIKEVEQLASDGSDLAAFYHTLKLRSKTRFVAFERMLRSLVPTVDGVKVETTRQGLLQLFVSDQGTDFSSRVVSEGTLRILGLLAITNPLIPSSLVGYEEPENGVHPRRLSLIARVLANAAAEGKTQFLAITHSTVLPDELVEIEDATLISCSREESRSRFAPFNVGRDLFLEEELERVLDDGAPPPTSIGERILRGDLG